jgi:hypothetical protein
VSDIVRVKTLNEKLLRLLNKLEYVDKVEERSFRGIFLSRLEKADEV